MSLKGDFTPLRFSSCFELLNLSSCVLQTAYRRTESATLCCLYFYKTVIKNIIKITLQLMSYLRYCFIQIHDMSQVFTNLKFNYLPLSISQNKTNKTALQTTDTRDSKLFKPNTQVLLLINLFKILNIWTQVYYMQNYWTSHGKREK